MTLREYYIGQALAGTDAAFPNEETGSEMLADVWAENTASRIVELVNTVLAITRIDGKKEIGTPR